MIGYKLTDEIFELSTNIDDMSSEDLGFAMDKIIEEGALDVYCQSIFMKKNRPAFKLCVLSSEDKAEHLAGVIFKHTSAIGIRKQRFERYILSREKKNIETPYGNVSIKISNGYGAEKYKIEFEDLKKISEKTGIGMDKLRKEIEKLI